MDGSPDTGDSESNAETSTVSPGDTAEIDVAAVEAKLKDPGSTMSFEPLTEERIETDSTYDAGTTTQLMWGARSDVGCVRPHNEDSYLVQSPLFCVCDGMGGHAAGEVASFSWGGNNSLENIIHVARSGFGFSLGLSNGAVAINSGNLSSGGAIAEAGLTANTWTNVTVDILGHDVTVTLDTGQAWQAIQSAH